MKQILASLLATYTLSNGQTIFPSGQIPVFPPPPPVDVPALINIASAAPQLQVSQAPVTTASIATVQTTASAVSPVTSRATLTSRTPLLTQPPITILPIASLPIATAPAATAPITTAAIAPIATASRPGTSAVPQAIVTAPNLPIVTAPGGAPYTPPGSQPLPTLPVAPVTTAGATITPPSRPATTGTATGVRPNLPIVTAPGGAPYTPPAAPVTTLAATQPLATPGTPATGGPSTGTGLAPNLPIVTAPGGAPYTPPAAPVTTLAATPATGGPSTGTGSGTSTGTGTGTGTGAGSGPSTGTGLPPNLPIVTAPGGAPYTPPASGPVTTVPPVIMTTTPAPTMNPYCTPGLATMAQQLLLNNAGQGYSSCTTYAGPGSIARDMFGQLECIEGGCCMCSEISCGLTPGMPCEQASFGDFSVAGVQNIHVKGSLMGNFGGGFQGTQISCNGNQACRASRIVGELIGELQCSGYYGCNDANIVINDPTPQFSLACEGEGGCAGANIEINIRNCASFAELGSFQFNGPMAATGAIITVNNYCPTPVIIEHLDCAMQGSCQGTSFRFNGAISIQQCEIFGAAQLPPQCFGGGGGGFGGFPQFNPYPQPGFPQGPGFGFPQQPGFPQGPLPPQQQPPAQQPPAQQPPVSQTPGQGQQPPAGPAPGQVTPPQTQPIPPQQPPTVPAPGQGQGQQPTPIQPQQPGFGQPQPQQPGFAQQPGFGMPMGFGAITSFGGVCEFAGQCRGPQNINVQGNMFALDCAEMGSCSGLALTLNIPPGGNVEFIEGFRFEAPFAAQGSSITINNPSAMYGGGNPIEIGMITCDVAQACAGVNIRAPGIDLQSLQFECVEPGACTGGSINGISFDMLVSGNFQGGGLPMMPQFPGQQQPGFPQQPGFGPPQQQPGFPQQPQPGFPQQQGGQQQFPPMGQYPFPPYQI